MNWTENYHYIRDYLNISGREDLAQYLDEIFSIGSTGGEIFDIGLSRILELNQQGLLDDVKAHVDAILNYARSIDHL